MAAPTWITPAGFIGTFTENIPGSVTFSAVGVIDFNLITGTIPGFYSYNINTSTDLTTTATMTVSGTPYPAGDNKRYDLVIRINNDDGVTDRSFYMDIHGASNPIWLTPPWSLQVGISNQHYAINGQYVDYQLTAITDALPPGQSIRYYISDLEGQLPPGLELSQFGRITGQIKDNLRSDYKIVNRGGYDLEAYDRYPYDHSPSKISNNSNSTRFLSKFYQFYITATDGVSSNKQLFSIKVEDPQSLRVDDTFIEIDTTEYLADAGYLMSPQWLTPINLGYVRASNKQIIPLSSYDFNPGLGTVTYSAVAEFPWKPFIDYKIGAGVTYNNSTYVCVQSHTSELSFEGTLWKLTQLPPYFNIDPKQGLLYANLPYQPAYTLSYAFTIFATKTDASNGNQTVSSREFTLKIKGNVESSIEFVTSPILGTIYPGHQSDLSIVAKHLVEAYTVQYRLVGGRLPTGITLLSDGSLSGAVEYVSQTYLIDSQSPTGFLLLDGGTTTFDRTYRFTVEATDIYRQSAIEQEFTLVVSETDLTRYTKIYTQPLLSRPQRQNYSNFINNTYTFDPALLFRQQDPAFGLQSVPKIFLEFGIQQVRLDIYADALRQYFYRKRFLFGEVTYSPANDVNGNYIYDAVYVKIIDPIENADQTGPIGSQTFSGQTVYTNSANNMRTALQSLKLNGETVMTDEFQMPRYMRTIQPSTGSPLGFVLAVPLCYALPGKGDTIIKRIRASGFDFTTIDFEIDRLIVSDNLTDSGAKYLLFPRKDLIGPNLGSELSYITGPGPLEIDTTDGNPLELEI
jgi:hypothetical protein